MNTNIQLSPRWMMILPLLLGVLFIVVLIRTAWLCDDAYISYRTLDNFMNGYGLTYNPGERVQAFTHPLWLLLHIPFYWVVGNMYSTGLVVAIICSVVAVLLLCQKVVVNRSGMVLVLAALIASKAFTDYATSGLENPMTHLLIVLFAWTWWKKGRRHLLLLSFIAGLAALNRMDTILLFVPALLVAWWPQKGIKATLTVLLGLLPFLLWEVFAVIYYGFPFPNSAYGKLNHGFEAATMWEQGGYYYLDSLTRDPITLIVIVAALVLPLLLKRKALWPWAAGMALYLLYIFYIGGDFMSGRFFCAPFLLGLIILARLELKINLVLAPVALALGFVGGAPLLSGADYGVNEEAVGSHGIADERAYYYPGTGLLTAQGREMPALELAERGKKLREGGGDIYLTGNMGFLGFYAGPGMYILDRYAVTSPFLARLPNVYQPNWRPGHYQRPIPRGYLNSLTTRTNQLEQPELRQLHNALNTVTRGPLWDSNRWDEIWKLNTGHYAAMIDKAGVFMPAKTQATLQEMNIAPGATGVVTYVDSGVVVHMPPIRQAREVYLWLQRECEFVVVFRKGEKVLGGEILIAAPEQPDPMPGRKVLAPLATDNVVVYPNTHHCPCAVGRIELPALPQ